MLRSTTLYVSIVFQSYLLENNFLQVNIINVVLKFVSLVFCIKFNKISTQFVLTLPGSQFIFAESSFCGRHWALYIPSGKGGGGGKEEYM